MKELSIVTNALSITQANDSLLFCEANLNSFHAVKRVLDAYKSAFGQQINFEKSVLSFSPNTAVGIISHF